MIPLGLYLDTYDNSVIDVTSYNSTYDNYNYSDLTNHRRGEFIPSSARAKSILHAPNCYSIADVHNLYPEYFI